MQFHYGTGCYITLLGALIEIPTLEMNGNGDLTATFTVQIISKNKTIEEYKVIAFEEKALTIKQYGFPGLHLCIKGDLEINSIDPHCEPCIIAHTVEFLSTEKSGTPSQFKKIVYSAFTVPH